MIFGIMTSITDLDAHHYSAHSSMQMLLAREILRMLNIKQDDTILDIGCGDGKISAELARKVPLGAIIGIDSSPAMIDFACKAYQSASNLLFKCASAEEFTLDKPVDIALLLNTLHWIRAPHLALKRIATSLKPGGELFILTYPKESPYWQFLDETLQESKWAPYAHLAATNTILTTDGYKDILIKAGFKIDTCSTKEECAIYSNASELSDYIKGWLPCYLPLPAELLDEFLGCVIKTAIRLFGQKKPLEIPFLKLTICAEKS